MFKSCVIASICNPSILSDTHVQVPFDRNVVPTPTRAHLWNRNEWRTNFDLPNEPVRGDWEHILRALDLKLHSVPNRVDSELSFIEDLPHIIHRHYTGPWTTFNQRASSRYYIAVMDKVSDHYQLLGAMETMMQQNIELNIGLDQAVWHRFFAIFYKLPFQFPDLTLSNLLQWMLSDGSRISPDLETIHVILDAVSTSKEMEDEDARDVVDFLFDDFIMKNGIVPTERSYRYKFGVYLNTGYIRCTVYFVCALFHVHSL